LAEALLRAWRDALGTDDIGLDDDFLAVGGTSLQAAQLFARVERIVGRSLPLSTLLGAGSVRALLAEVGRPLPRSGSLVPIRSSGTRAPLYVVSGVGGNIVGLYGLARHLGPDQPVSAFESPGLDGREPPLTSIEDIAQRYVDELAGLAPHEYHLLGICWGAAVVFEMARRLQALGRAPTSLMLMNPAVLLRDLTARPARPELNFARGRLQLYWDEFREGNWRDRSRMLADKARRAARVLTGGEALERSLSELNHARVLEANLHAVTRYIPQCFAGRARIFLTDRDMDEGDDPRLEWFTLIEPVPSVASIGGHGAGTAISPAHVGGFASALQAWLMSPPEA
jgi:thioesterase domain-containing protein